MYQGKRVLKKETRKHSALRVLLILLLIAAALYFGWRLLVPEPEVAVPAMNLAEGGEASVPAGYSRKKHFWTFLLAGTDKSGYNTDSLILLSYDADAQTVSMASIPRDTCVDANGNGKQRKINAAYANAGMDELLEETTRTFGIPIDYYIKVNVNGFVALVDAVGGVDFEVPCAMNYDDPYQDLYIHYDAGMQHLSGQQALEVCRFRHNNDNTGYNDTGRMQTQRGVLTAVAKKLLSLQSITKLNKFINIAAENTDTNLSVSDMAWFAEKALSFDMENLNTMMMPASWSNPYMFLDPAATLELVNTYLNPYTKDLTEDMLRILS